MNDLFPGTFSLSPRLKWIGENHVTTLLSLPEDLEGRLWLAGFNPTQKETIGFFRDEYEANGDMLIGEGQTEDEAIIDLCQKTGTPHWTVAP